MRHQLDASDRATIHAALLCFYEKYEGVDAEEIYADYETQFVDESTGNRTAPLSSDDILELIVLVDKAEALEVSR